MSGVQKLAISFFVKGMFFGIALMSVVMYFSR